MKDNFLTSYGWNDSEFLVYQTLVTRGPLTMSDIVVISSLHRPYAYKTVESLMKKKAVHLSPVKHKKLYAAESPQKIKQLLEEEKEKASEKLDALEELYVSPHLKTIITHFQGKKGLTDMFADLVKSQKKGDIFYRYTSEKDTDYTNTLLPKDYRAIRDKKQLERFVISTLDIAAGKEKRLERATKIIPKNETSFNQDCIQLIYGNKVAFMDIAQLQGVVIENKNLAQFQKEIFKLLYKRL
jgi:sugar-specific transcriptional regulator TrmB